MDKEITSKELKEAIKVLEKAHIKDDIEGWFGTPYGILTIGGKKIKGNKKAKQWFKNLILSVSDEE